MKMEKEQLIHEMSTLVEKIVAEKSPHLVREFNGKDWFEQWMRIPNTGLGHTKPEELLEKDPDRVRQYLQRVDIAPFARPWGF